MITKDKVFRKLKETPEIFCMADDFCKEFDNEVAKMGLEYPKDARRRNRAWRMSRSEIMTILICFHFGSFRNFKHYYRKRSVFNFAMNALAAIAAYGFFDKKPSINIDFCIDDREDQLTIF